MKHVVASGMAVGLPSLAGLDFRPDKPHTCCRICGAVFQTDADRALPVGVLQGDPGLAAYEIWAAENQRRRWSHNHAKTHSEREHRQLQLSGRFCTPEAAHKLAAFGVISVSDAVLDEEYEHALLESNPVPYNDAEG